MARVLAAAPAWLLAVVRVPVPARLLAVARLAAAARPPTTVRSPTSVRLPTAAQSLLGSRFRVTQRRSEVVELPDREERAVVTAHPSSVLRAEDREAAYEELLADLKSAAAALT